MTIRRLPAALAVVGSVLLTGAAFAKEIEGVRFADETHAGALTLRLNDVGLMRYR
jgi:hypothetical protein